MNADELFSFTPTGQVKLKEPTKNRLEWYDNGTDCKKPVTQYGMVLDINKSNERYNLNFDTITIEEMVQVAEAATTGTETYRCIMALLTRYAQPDVLNHPEAYITVSKQNKLSGTGQHDIGYGRGAHCYQVAAIALVDPARAPKVLLFLNGEEYVFPDGDWEAVRNSSHPNKRYQSKF